MKKIIWSVVLVFLGLWVTGIILENFFNVDLDKYFSCSGPAPQAAEPGWKTYTYNDYHFSIDSPIELIKGGEPVTTLKGILLEGKDMDKVFFVHVHAFEYPSPEADLQNLMDKQIKMLQIMRDKSMPNLQMASNPITIDNTPGILAEGTYQSQLTQLQKSFEIKNIMVKKGSVLTEVMLQFESNDGNKVLSDKILHSFHLLN